MSCYQFIAAEQAQHAVARLCRVLGAARRGYYAWRTHREARLAVFSYLETFYNRVRRHSAQGYLSPAEYERRYAASPALAAAS